MKYHTISQGRLKETLTYIPATGVFVWNGHFGGSSKKGKIAGTKKKDGYINITVDGIDMRAHRIAWIYTYGSCDTFIDHINQERHDNRLSNLRAISGHSDNAKNTKLSTKNTSGVVGVCWSTHSKKWVAQLGHKGKVIWLGKFSRFEDAVDARKAGEQLYNFHENHGLRKEKTNA